MKTKWETEKINETLSNQVKQDLNLQSKFVHRESVILELKAELLSLRTHIDQHNEQLKLLDQEKSSLNEKISKYETDIVEIVFCKQTS